MSVIFHSRLSAASSSCCCSLVRISSTRVDFSKQHEYFPLEKVSIQLRTDEHDFVQFVPYIHTQPTSGRWRKKSGKIPTRKIFSVAFFYRPLSSSHNNSLPFSTVFCVVYIPLSSAPQRSIWQSSFSTKLEFLRNL